MKLTLKSDYAVRAAITLARRFSTGNVTRIEEIATENRIPPNYLVQILIDMKSGNIVRSIRGKAGGYLLARPPGTISLADILNSVEGPLLDFPSHGTVGKGFSKVEAAWIRLQEVMQREASSIHLNDLAELSTSSGRAAVA